MNKVFRVALVGCGGISGNHLTGLTQAGQTVCALCDTVPERAKKRAEEFGLRVPIYTDYSEMLQKEHPDAVHICTPHYLHVPMAIEALGMDIHVLCEKPLGINMDELQAVRRAAEKSRAQIGVCLQNRWRYSSQKMKELAAGGVSSGFGNVVWQRDAEYYDADAWRGTMAQEGGGVMINQAVHTLDLLQWICGMPVYVTARTENWHLQGKIEVEDTATALFETADGTRLNFFATTAGGGSFPVQLMFRTKDGKRITGSNNYVICNDELIPDEEGNRQFIGKEVWGTQHNQLIADFYRCIAEGKHFPLDAQEGGKAMQLVFAMYASKGKRIAIPQ